MSLLHPLVSVLLSVTVASAPPGPSAPLEAGSGWHADLDAAMAVAREEGKHLFVNFTGSDWCKYCIQLDGETFSKPEFLARARESYVLVAVDFPAPDGETFKAMPADLVRRNQEHEKAFAVEGYPTILLMTPEGWVYGRLGYQPGGMTAFLAQLDEAEAQRDGLLSAYRDLQLAPGARDAERLAAAHTLFRNAWLLRPEDRERVIDVVRQLDRDDSKLILAYLELDGFIQRHLVPQGRDWSPDWQGIRQALVDLRAARPSVARLAEFHAYEAMALAWLGDEAGAESARVRARDIGMPPPMSEWLDGQIQAARDARTG